MFKASDPAWSQIIVLIGTAVLLIVSISWVDTLSAITKKLHFFDDPFIGQIIYTVLITIVGIIILITVKPFKSNDKQVPPGAERALRDMSDIPLMDVI